MHLPPCSCKASSSFQHTSPALLALPFRFDKSTEQLAGFLSHLASLDKLTVDNGVYRKKQAPSKPSENG